MKKMYAVGLALLAVFMFASITASGASAETVWLVSGALIAEKVPATIEGNLKIDILAPLIGLVVEFECSGRFVGNVGPDAQDEITEVFDLLGNKIGELTGAGADCTVLAAPVVCTSSAKLGELWPESLPWPTLIELMAAGEEEFLDIIGLVNGVEKDPAFDFKCEESGGSFTEGLCEGQLTAVLLNTAENDVLGIFLEQDQPCTNGNTAHVTGEGLITVNSGLTLAVSEG